MILRNKIGVTLVLLIIGIYNTISQEVISSAGNYNSSNTGSVSWVLGEVIQSNMATLSNESNNSDLQSTEKGSSVAINELIIEYTIYPNPFTDYIFIAIKNGNESKPYRLNIYSIHGKLISTKLLHQASTLIPLKEITAGNYLAQIQSEGNYSEAINLIKSK